MLVAICTKCQTKLAISPEGLCNICDEEALQKRTETRVIPVGIGKSNTAQQMARILAAHRTGIPPIIVKPEKK